MTTLEIKRLDSHPPLQQQATAYSKYGSNRSSAMAVITSNGGNGDYMHEIPINIIKSPSYNQMQQQQQQTSPSKAKLVVPAGGAGSTASPSTVTITNSSVISKSQSSGSSINNNNNNNTSTSNRANHDDFDSVLVAQNNAGLAPDAAALTFNKYGFLQPVGSSSNGTDTLSSSKTTSNTLSREAATATIGRSGKAKKDGSPDAARRNDDVSQLSDGDGGGGGGGAATNLKDYIQNTDVEEFAEQLPVDVIRSRETKWIDMLKSFDEWMDKRFRKVKSRCRKGIPQSMRSRAWMHLSGAVTEKSKRPSYYGDCLQNLKNVDVARYIEDIKKDLHRQFPGHEIFMKREGRQMLYNVLRAYAVHNREVGYCQAQGPIAAVLLMHMPEEDAFWMLVQISDVYLKEYFKPGLEKVQIDGQALFYLFKQLNPTAHKLLKSQSIDPILYMTEWFMCVYARTLPWCTILRVWDMFFCEGVKVLYRVGLFLMRSAFGDRDKLQRCKQQGMYETMNLLKNLPVENLHEAYLVRESSLIKISEQDLIKAFDKSKVEFARQMSEMQKNRRQPPPQSSYVNTNKSSDSNKKQQQQQTKKPK